MTLTQKHEIRRGSDEYKILDEALFLSRNLYNVTLFLIRQEYFKKPRNYLSYYKIQRMLQDTNDPDYRALPSKVAQAVIKGCCDNFSSFLKAKKDYYKNPGKYRGEPRLPRYKKKPGERNLLCYNYQAVSKKDLREGYITLSKIPGVKIPTDINEDSLCCVRIIPGTISITVEIAYEIEDPKLLIDNNLYAAIDLGVNNLATVSSNSSSFQPFVIDGRKVKSFNQYYNKKVAKETGRLKKANNVSWSLRLSRLSHKRDNKMSDYFHKASRYVVNQLVDNNINTLIIGKNNGWKQDTSMGKVNNQKFVMIPYEKFIQKLTYKCNLVGINVIVITEEYTSKCSFLDNEVIGKHNVYAGKRVHRGLFVSGKGRKINADLNGSLNILRKCKPNSFMGNGVLDVVVHPRIVRYDSF